MTSAEGASARLLAYGLLADLLEHGLAEQSGKARAAALTSPALRAALEEVGPRSEEAEAEEHQWAFGWAVHPFEGAYLHPEGRIGGRSSEILRTKFEEIGFHPDFRRSETEHLSTSLRALAFLSGAEADAHRDGEQGAIARTRLLSLRLLEEHLMRWLPLFVGAVGRLERPYPRALVGQIEELLLHHLTSLKEGGLSLCDPLPFELPEAGASLEDPETGFREIAARLASPARSGLVLGRVDIARLGRSHQLPRGFGDRAQLLTNLLRSATRYEALGALLGALEEEAGRQDAALADPRYAVAAAAIAPWRARLEETRAWLAEARRRVEEGAELDRSAP